MPFDWVGQVVAILGMGALTYGLIEGAAGFGAPWVLGALVVLVFGALVAHRETFLAGLRVSLLIAALLLLATASASLLLRPAWHPAPA